MGRLSNRAIRKAGMQVPDYIQDLMSSLHPTVDIMWDTSANVWVMVQTIGRKSQIVGRLRPGEPLTLQNTVYHLNKIHPHNFRTPYQRDRLLKELDESEVNRDLERSAADARRVGSGELYDKLKGRIVVPVRG